MIMVSGYLFKKNKGFTLLEVVIAMGLMAFCLMSMGALLITLGNIEAGNTKAVKALFCAQEALETLRFKLMAGQELLESSEQEVIPDGAYQGMEKQWSIEAYDPEDDLHEIIVQCAYWWKGKKKATSLRTLVCISP